MSSSESLSETTSSQSGSSWRRTDSTAKRRYCSRLRVGRRAENLIAIDCGRAFAPGSGRSIRTISTSEPNATAVPRPAPEPELLDTPHAGAVAVRGSVLRAGAYTGSVLLALVSAPLLIRHLGIREFGRYVAVLSLVTIVSGMTEAGLNAIAMREYTTAPAERRPRLMANLLGVRLALGVVGVLAAVAFAAVAGYGAALVAGTALAGVGMVVLLAQSLLTVPLQVELRLGWVSALELVRQLVVVLLIVALVVAGAGVTPFLAYAVPGR